MTNTTINENLIFNDVNRKSGYRSQVVNDVKALLASNKMPKEHVVVLKEALSLGTYNWLLKQFEENTFAKIQVAKSADNQKIVAFKFFKA